MRLNSSFLVFVFASVALAEKCETPNKENAECVSLYACPVILTALAAQATQPNSSVVEFVEKSTCGGTTSHPLVCCGSTYTFMVPQNRHNVDELLPGRSYCGYQHADDYFREGSDISIHEFPWFANLLYLTDNVTNSRCGATLISNKYVLTAAQCVTAPGTKLIAVWLGQYYRGNKGDCVEAHSDFEECSERQNYGIEKVIPHSGFNRQNFSNDIALIRLNMTVSWSDYIRPICLPIPGPTLAKVGDTLTTTGWGLTVNDTYTEKKKKILLKLISKAECIQANKYWAEKLLGNQLCTLNQENNTDSSCEGDAGSPVMFSFRSQWHQEGLLSFGLGLCSSRPPDVYTKVVDYVDWIKENIEP